jgi:hypothetical protein
MDIEVIFKPSESPEEEKRRILFEVFDILLSEDAAKSTENNESEKVNAKFTSSSRNARMNEQLLLP